MGEPGGWRPGRLPRDFQSRNQRKVITSDSRACSTKASVARRPPGDPRAARLQMSPPCGTQRPGTAASGQRHNFSSAELHIPVYVLTD